MWDGALAPTVRKSVVDHFDVVGIQFDEVIGIVYVTIVFHNTPNKQYIFEIEADRFQPDKDSIGAEILRQLRA